MFCQGSFPAVYIHSLFQAPSNSCHRLGHLECSTINQPTVVSSSIASVGPVGQGWTPRGEYFQKLGPQVDFQKAIGRYCLWHTSLKWLLEHYRILITPMWNIKPGRRNHCHLEALIEAQIDRPRAQNEVARSDYFTRNPISSKFFSVNIRCMAAPEQRPAYLYDKIPKNNNTQL